MKKILKFGVLPACVLLLGACSMLPRTEKKKSEDEKTEQSSSSSSEKETNEKRIEKDADIILRAVFTDHSSGFTTLMGTSVDKWKKGISQAYVDENISKYTPEEDYTIDLKTESFTPSKTLELFDQARFKVLATIGDDFEITGVEDDEDTATVTFKSRAIATRDLANVINLAKASLFENGIEDVKDAKKLIYNLRLQHEMAGGEVANITKLKEKKSEYNSAKTILNHVSLQWS